MSLLRSLKTPTFPTLVIQTLKRKKTQDGDVCKTCLGSATPFSKSTVCEQLRLAL